jgi:MFS superfamily sulfate permease-like transporter
LAGFVTAIGGLLLVDQTPKVLGIPPCGDCEDLTHLKVVYLIKSIFNWDINWRTALIGVSCVLFLFLFQYLKHRDPDSKVLSRTPHIFLMVLIVTGLSYALELEKYGVIILGAQKGGIPAPSMPVIPSLMFSQYLSAAITLSVLGFVETQLVNKMVNPTGATISPNRELVALGAMHITNAVFGGYTAFGSLTRTKVAQRAGSRSQVSSLVAGVMLLMAILFLMPFFAHMPTAVTAAIIFYVATSLLETHDLIFCYRMRQWVDLSLLVSMAAVTFFFGVDTGLFFAFACCLLLVIKQQHKPAVRLLGRAAAPSAVAANVTNGSRMRGVERMGGDASGNTGDAYYELEESSNIASEAAFEGILIYQIDGPLFFCNSEGLKDRTRRIEFLGSVICHPSEPVRPIALRCIIFDMTAVTSVDATAAQVLLEVIDDYKKRNVRVIFVKLRKALKEPLENSGVLGALGMENVLLSIDAAIESVEESSEAEAGDSEAEAKVPVLAGSK